MKATTIQNGISGFQKSGIELFSTDLFIDADFAPSDVFVQAPAEIADRPPNLDLPHLMASTSPAHIDTPCLIVSPPRIASPKVNVSPIIHNLSVPANTLQRNDEDVRMPVDV